MTLAVEVLKDHWVWWRIATAAWSNPLDPSFAECAGGRWNSPNSFPTLYLNENHVTARLNLRAFIAEWPYQPEDLRSDTGPVLVGATLPRQQRVCDIHSPKGVSAAGLPRTFPFERQGHLIAHSRCQPIGHSIKSQGLRGVRTRSAQTRGGTGRELAWFPATSRSIAKRVAYLTFENWYWA